MSDFEMDASANDLRFQFEIIRGLSESVRTQTEAIMRMQDMQTDIVARLERIEAKEIALQVAELEARILILEADGHRREGAMSVVTAIMKSPSIGWIVGGATFIWAIITKRIDL